MFFVWGVSMDVRACCYIFIIRLTLAGSMRRHGRSDEVRDYENHFSMRIMPIEVGREWAETSVRVWISLRFSE
jgi:hypothetical protein